MPGILKYSKLCPHFVEVLLKSYQKRGWNSSESSTGIFRGHLTLRAFYFIINNKYTI